MKIRPIVWLSIAALCGPPALALAAPPTVTPSPGYDARLREQRAATSGATMTVTPSRPPVTTRKHTH